MFDLASFKIIRRNRYKHRYMIVCKRVHGATEQSRLLIFVQAGVVVQPPPGHSVMLGPANIVLVHSELGQPGTSYPGYGAVIQDN